MMTYFRKALLISLLAACFGLLGACAEKQSSEVSSNETTVRSKKGDGDMIRLRINGTEFHVVLEKNSAVKKLQEILPDTFSMNDLHQNEKYYDLSQKLPTNAQRVGMIEAGDVMLYGNSTLVIFYHSFETSYSYTRIGRIKNEGNLADQLGNGALKVERIH